MFTDGEIRIILEKAEIAWRVNKIPVGRQENFLLTLKTFLVLSQNGTIENVCPCCLGS